LSADSGTRNIGSLCVTSCAVKKNVIVASQLYDVADVQVHSRVDRVEKVDSVQPLWK